MHDFIYQAVDGEVEIDASAHVALCDAGVPR
jgi:hypothetical protein